MMRKITYTLVVVTFVFGCGDSTEFSPAMPPQTAAGLAALVDDGSQPEFEPLPGIPVFGAEIDLLRQTHPDDSREELAGMVAQRKLLARRALEAGLGDDFDIAFVYRRALAHAFLRHKFEEEHGPGAVPLDIWRSIFRDPAVFPIYDHKDLFFVADAQLICCSGAPNLCRGDPQVQICMQDFEPESWQIYEDLKERRITDVESFKERVEELKTEHPQLGAQEFSFQYDFKLTWDQQRGYPRVDEAVALRAEKAPLKQVMPPVRSNHGWHILFIKDFQPETHRQFEEPEVQADLQERFYDQVRQVDVLKHFDKAIAAGKLQVHEKALRDLDWARITGLK